MGRRVETVKKKIEDQELKVSMLLEKLKMEQEKKLLEKHAIGSVKQRNVDNYVETM